jgi:hypothetical protein
MVDMCRRRQNECWRKDNVEFNKKYQQCIIVTVLKHCINDFILTSYHLTYINSHRVTCPWTKHPKPLTNICMRSATEVFKLPNQHDWGSYNWQYCQNSKVKLRIPRQRLRRGLWQFESDLCTWKYWRWYIEVYRRREVFVSADFSNWFFSHHQGFFQWHLNCWTLGIMVQLTQLLFTRKCVRVTNRLFSYLIFFMVVFPCIINLCFRQPTRCSSKQSLFIYCQVTLHVSGVFRTHYQEYTICSYNHGYKSCCKLQRYHVEEDFSLEEWFIFVNL